MKKQYSPSNRIAWLLIQEGSNHGFSSDGLIIFSLLYRRSVPALWCNISRRIPSYYIVQVILVGRYGR